MPVFDITGPDGKTYEIEGADAKGALSALLKHLGGTAPTTTSALAPEAEPDQPQVPQYDQMGNSMGSVAGAPMRAGMPYGEQMQNVGRVTDDFVRASAKGLTFGLADKFAGGMDYLTGQAPSYDEGVKAQRARTDALPSDLRTAGEITGGLAGGMGLIKNGVTLAGRLGHKLFPKFLGYGAEGGAYGAAHGAGNTYSDNPADYVKNAKEEAKLGAIVGGALPVVGKAAGAAYRGAQAFVGPRIEGTSAGASALLRAAAQADEPGLRALPSMGDEAMLVDAGPAMLGLGQGAGTGTGQGRSALVNALRNRDATTVPRINRDLDSAIGPAPTPSRIEAGIDDNLTRVGPQYAGPFDQSRAVNTQAIANELDTLAVDLRGPARRAVTQVREYLNIPGTRALDPNPNALFQTRQAIDGLLEQEQNSKVIAQLTRARGMVDEELARAVPGIKQVDAKWHELERQREGLGRGSQVFDTGKTATRPNELAAELRAGAQPHGELVGPSGTSVRIRQGARAEVDRLVGTHANDLNALERKLGTPQDWNSQKFAAVFGEGPHAQVMSSLMNNRRFRQSYQDIVQNSQTAQRTSSANAMEGTAGGNVPGDTTITGLGLKALNAVARAVSGASTKATKDEIGQILASQGQDVQRIARQLLRSARKTNENTRAINRVLSSPYWIGASSPAGDRRARQ